MQPRLRMLQWALPALILVGPSPAGAAKPPASSASFRIDPANSRVYIKVAKATRLGHDHGVAGRLSTGTINLGGRGELTFAMKTFKVDEPDARRYVGLQGTVSASDQQKTTANMLSSDVLDVARFPSASYAIASAAPMDGQAPGDPGRYRLAGSFTLHGATQPLALVAVAEKTSTAGTLRLKCSFAVDQSHFGITPYSAVGGLVGIADCLEIWGDLVLRTANR